MSSSTSSGTSPSSPSVFKIINGHASLSKAKTDSDAFCQGFQFDFHVNIPNYSVLMEFTPNTFQAQGSQNAFERFLNIGKKAVDGFNFDENDLHELLLPFMRQFREKVLRGDIKSAHEALTLKDVEFRGCYELTCSYINDEPTLELFELAPKPDSFTLPNHLADGSVVPIFNHGEVLIPLNGRSDNRHATRTSCTPPEKVTVNGKPYLYHPLAASIAAMREEIDEHVKIITSGLSYYDMRILPLCGIILDDNNQVAGLLKEWQSTYEEDFLERVLSENEVDPDHLNSWANQFDNAVANIREAGLGLDPKVWDVAVNKTGDVWIVYLKDGRVPIHGCDVPNWRGRGMPGMSRFLRSLGLNGVEGGNVVYDLLEDTSSDEDFDEDFQA